MDIRDCVFKTSKFTGVDLSQVVDILYVALVTTDDIEKVKELFGDIIELSSLDYSRSFLRGDVSKPPSEKEEKILNKFLYKDWDMQVQAVKELEKVGILTFDSITLEKRKEWEPRSSDDKIIEQYRNANVDSKGLRKMIHLTTEGKVILMGRRNPVFWGYLTYRLSKALKSAPESQVREVIKIFARIRDEFYSLIPGLQEGIQETLDNLIDLFDALRSFGKKGKRQARFLWGVFLPAVLEAGPKFRLADKESRLSANLAQWKFEWKFQHPLGYKHTKPNLDSIKNGVISPKAWQHLIDTDSYLTDREWDVYKRAFEKRLLKAAVYNPYVIQPIEDMTEYIKEILRLMY
jgi:hypothetical protein